MKEQKTTALIKSVIAELGVEQIQLQRMEVGAACIIRGKKPGPTLALRADMDALPLEEKTGLDYASKIPVTMHACGHDLNTTILIGVLQQMVERRIDEHIAGNIKFLFQPAEETLEGARLMIDAQVLQNPKVDMILMSHGDPDLKVGQVGLFSEFSHANSDTFIIEMKGTGGHAARPYETQDLVLTGSYIITMFQSIISRNLDARDIAVLSVSSFNAGNAPNIIPSTARLTGTVRTLADNVQEIVQNRMQEICASAATAFHLEVSFQYNRGTPSCKIDAHAEALLLGAVSKHIQRKDIFDLKTRMGGEDFAYFSRLVPAGVMRLGVTPPDSKKYGSTHSSTFRADMNAIPVGVKILCQAVEDYFKCN